MSVGNIGVRRHHGETDLRSAVAAAHRRSAKRPPNRVPGGPAGLAPVVGAAADLLTVDDGAVPVPTPSSPPVLTGPAAASSAGPISTTTGDAGPDCAPDPSDGSPTVSREVTAGPGHLATVLRTLVQRFLGTPPAGSAGPSST